MLGIVDKVYRPVTGRREWALLSKSSHRPLKWWGTRKPSPAMIRRQERIVKYYSQRQSRQSLQLITVEEFKGIGKSLRGDEMPSRWSIGATTLIVGFLIGWSLASPD